MYTRSIHRNPTTRLATLFTLATGTATVTFACSNNSDDTAQSEQVVLGRAAAASGGLPSVITLTPQAAPTEPPSTTAVMDQFGIAFIPRLLVTRVGQAVEFRNSEAVDHNVRVVQTATDSMLFNVVTPIGEPYTYTFSQPGRYDVACDIHPGMTAFIVVVAAPHATVADDDGSFTFTNIAPGAYTATVWNADPTNRIERSVEIGEGRTELVLTGAAPGGPE